MGMVFTGSQMNLIWFNFQPENSALIYLQAGERCTGIQSITAIPVSVLQSTVMPLFF
jgi:hypothetical protein